VRPYAPEPESNGRQRDLLFAGFVLVMAFSTMYLSPSSQQSISSAFQATALRPFIEVQRRLEAERVRGVEVDAMMEMVDSLSLLVSTHSALIDENQTLRALLDLGERAGPSFRPATVLRPGTPGSASIFLVDIGADDGIRQGSAVVGPFGLVGVIREVRARDAVGMDWTHPEFRVSAMIENGSAFGLVENRPGLFREEDRLVLNGIPFNQAVARASRVVTSGLGGVFPRGIPIGRTDDVADAEGSWRKSYWLNAFVEPGAATHVLVLTRDVNVDASGIWPSDSVRADSVVAGGRLP
jgi:rod shape-determining protein MreC